MILLIIIDQIDKDLNNDFYYYCLSCLLSLTSSDIYGIRTCEENKIDYKFDNINVIYGDVVDYLICFFIRLTEERLKIGDFDSVWIFLPILGNISFYSVYIEKSTC